MEELTDESIMPFGKHKGTKLANVPADYLLFCYQTYKLSAPLKKYIEDNMDSIKQEIRNLR